MKTQSRLRFPERFAPSACSLLLVTALGCGPVPGDREGTGDGLGSSVPNEAVAPATAESASHPADAVEATASALLTANDKVPAEVMSIATFATTLSSAFSGFASGVNAAQTVLTMAGIIKKHDPAAEFNRLRVQLEEMTEAGIFKETASAEDKRYAAVLGAVLAGESAVAIGQRLAFDGTSDTLSRSAALEPAVNQKSAFLRLHRESVNDGAWKKIIPDRPAVSHGLIYDWRQGLPHLMQLIAMRMQVMGAVDPQFAATGRHDPELLKHRTHLLDQLRIMRDGVRCGRKATLKGVGTLVPAFVYKIWKVDAVCADMYTGIERRYSYDYSEPGTCSIYNCPIGDVTAAFAAADRALDRLRREVLAVMPLFEAQSMADTMGSYATRGKALTQANGLVPMWYAPGICMDVQWGSAERGTPVWTWNCDGNVAQIWTYDRKSGQIRNRGLNKCLDVQWGSRFAGAPVWTWDCTGDIAQKWTYDPIGRVLTNALGTILKGAWEAGTPLVTADPNSTNWFDPFVTTWKAVP